jgi:hypothetical protein
VIHLILQISYKWVSVTGLIAAALMVLTVALGAYGFFQKKSKQGPWLRIHRIAAALLLVAILLHTQLGI